MTSYGEKGMIDGVFNVPLIRNDNTAADNER